MRYSLALKWAENQLKPSATAHLDALVLLEDITGLDRAKILTNMDQPIEGVALKSFRNQISERAQHIPLAYIRKQSEFYGRTFYIDERVLEPRPESEALIDELKLLINSSDAPTWTVIDIGTGSGAIIITAKLECPLIQAFGSDIDQNCLAVAEINARRHNTTISWQLGDLVHALPNKIWIGGKVIVLANLPYVPDNWHINLAASHEPRQAIFGGADGLDRYRKLFNQLTELTKQPCFVLCESLPLQHQELEKIASNNGYALVKTIDFIQVFTGSALSQV